VPFLLARARAKTIEPCLQGYKQAGYLESITFCPVPSMLPSDLFFLFLSNNFKATKPAGPSIKPTLVQ